MKNDHGTTEREVASFEIRGLNLLSAAGAAVRESALALGLSQAEADGLRAATEALIRDVVEQGFPKPEEATFDICLVERPGELVIRVDDQGIPRDFQSFHAGEDTVLDNMLRSGFADGLRLLSLGRSGNRAEIFKRFSTDDVCCRLSIEEHEARAAAPEVDPDAPIEIRFLKPEEATELARCVYRSYGYSYDADWVYQPKIIADKIQTGVLHSCVGVAAEGEIVGHVGLTFSEPGARVGESGQAVVDPRYRGHHLFTSLKRFMADWATQEGVYGMYSEATAVHPYSQKANLALGAHETGLLLGYIPRSVDYKEIQRGASDRRQSVTLFYLKTNEGPRRPVYAPERHRPMIGRILETSGLHGELADAASPKLEAATRVESYVRRDHNQAVISVEAFGPDFGKTLSERLKNLCLLQLDCIYLDVPLADPATAHLGGEVDDMGFFFGGVFPNIRRDGDVLRLQFLNNVDVRADDIQVASDFGRELFQYIDESRPR